MARLSFPDQAARTQDAGVQAPAIRPALSHYSRRDLQRIRFSASSDQPSDAEDVPSTGQPRMESSGCMSAAARLAPDSTATSLVVSPIQPIDAGGLLLAGQIERQGPAVMSISMVTLPIFLSRGS
jgi:hypothetical protein